jgi:ribosomal protein S12 methylthiotransferase
MKTVRCVSLGCPKNLIDAEVMLGNLSQAGYRILDESDTQTKPDVFLVNTCCFIKEAEAESRDIIRQAARQGGDSRVIVAGCLAQRYPKQIVKEFGQKIDAVVGIFERDKIAQICDGLCGRVSVSAPAESCRDDGLRLRITPRHYAYLRIAEGCNNRCSYCVIPGIHGAYRSKPPQAVMAEARKLAAGGVKELNIIAQDTTSYKYGKTDLAGLLEMLSRVKGVQWIRLLYTHPAHYTGRLIEAVARIPRVVKYLDLPIQHISNRILRRMERKVTAEEIKGLIARLRSSIPGLFIRSTVIVGFPGETDKDFRELLDFLEEVEFERLGAFRYSPEPGTRAVTLKEQVPAKLKDERFDAVMSLQQAVAFRQNRKLLNKNMEIIIDKIRRNSYVGRTYGDAPEVDGNIFVKTAVSPVTRSSSEASYGEVIPLRGANRGKAGRKLNTGDIVRVRVTGTKKYDLKGCYHD